MITEVQTFRAGVVVGLITAGLPLVAALCVYVPRLQHAEKQLAQYNKECSAEFASTLSQCFVAQSHFCGMGDWSCSDRVMERCNEIATGAYCTGRKK